MPSVSTSNNGGPLYAYVRWRCTECKHPFKMGGLTARKKLAEHRSASCPKASIELIPREEIEET